MVLFLCSTNYDDSDTTYVALTLMKDYDAPHIILLGNTRKFEQLSESDLFGGLGSEMYSLIWKPILEDASDSEIKRICFSVDGLLYNLPIEYCATPGGKMMMEQYRCYRLSSTRELVCNKETIAKTNILQNKNIVLYGGIDYDANEKDLLAANEKTKSEHKSPIDYPLYATRSADFREKRDVGFALLEGSEKEVLGITKTLSKNNIKAETFSKQTATKESVKIVADGSLRILHFATHGIYVTPEEKEFYPFLRLDYKEEEDGTEDEMLSRSALVMAGANTFSYEAADTVAYYAQDNGILTAREISLLNLTGLELAVLSACETARGDISGDGVFGLQRGFKKAGTQSLMMSLIKVDDDATRLFMQTFYDYLFSDGRGNVSKYDALLAAINRVRKESKGKWSDKEFRAPFILLDAID